MPLERRRILGNNKKKDLSAKYKNGGDGMFFFHKKTGHPAKQIVHTEKTWTNKRYTHHPNNMKNYEEDVEMSSEERKVYYQKTLFVDPIYTRGKPYRMKKKKR